MVEKIKHGRSKLISNYGGIGSVIDTQDSSIIIETFDNWHYPNHYDSEIRPHIILDDRLLSRLKTRFPRLRQLVSIPTEEHKTTVQPQANYFPKWFYCPHCKRFMHYKEWKDRWRDPKNFNLQCFNPECKEEQLDQVRFVMTCDNGHIQDLPWEYWNNRHIENPENILKAKSNPESDDDVESESKICLKYEKCCTEQELKYEISGENTDLSGIHIKCKKCGKSESLKGVFGFSLNCGGRKYWLGLEQGGFKGEDCDKKASVKIKSSNSIYYANTLSSLWIPDKQVNITNEQRLFIESGLERGKSNDQIINDLLDYHGIPKELALQYFEEPENTHIPEIIYRKAEYEYFLNKDQPESKIIKFRQINVTDKLYGFEKLVKIDKLKKITVQTSFTRNEPIDIDSILIGENGYEYKVKRQSVSKNSFETRLLPAIENYGEGILFVLDGKKLTKWESNEEVVNRTKIIQDYGQNSDWQSHKIEAKSITARKVLIHTLAHLVIKELEYVCGYPMSSLQERLYVSDSMHGFLISAFDGTDGYLGGLSKLCNNIDNLREIITSALNRAKDCSLDPICYESEGQGIAQLNLAACHSCTLIPETSCELGNLFLDRRFLIDEIFGYFKE